MITLEDIHVGFGSRTILDGISARLAEGRITAVMGPNGCGKTTLLRCIGGLLHPSQGQVLIADRPVGSYTARQLARQVAFVRQQAQTDFDFSAFEIVLMGRNPCRTRARPTGTSSSSACGRRAPGTSAWHVPPSSAVASCSAS